MGININVLLILQVQIFILLNFISISDALPNIFLDWITPSISQEYDFIIIGAGSGGTVLAERLSANPYFHVLLIEAGIEGDFSTDVPLMAAYAASRQNWGYVSEREGGSCQGFIDQKCHAVRGKVLGGCSAINFLVHTRGNPEDYNSWANMGNPGWSYDEVLPYFKMLEDCSECRNVDAPLRGFDGAIKIEHPRLESKLLDLFLRARSHMGYSLTDPNGYQQMGFSEAQATMERGRRCSGTAAFLTPKVRSRLNLQIYTNTLATKILINNDKQAYGVEIVRNGRKSSVIANKEVILAAGAYNSPQLLMLSGVGPAEHLGELGITVVADLKVGYNLQDHVSLTHLLFLVNEPITVSDTVIFNPIHDLNYVLFGNGPLSIPGGALGLAFIKANQANSSIDNYPNIELVLAAGGLNGDTMGTLREGLRLPEATYEKVYGRVSGIPGFSIVPILLRPKSTGRIMLRDKDPLHAPLIYSNFFGNEEDLEVLMEGVKAAITVTAAQSFKEVNTKLHNIPLPGCEHAPFNSDDYWRCVLRNVAASLGHPVGTCKMGPVSDSDSVVDSQLRVKGIKGLRIADASIMPHIIAGHPNIAVMMIAQKASDMIKEGEAVGIKVINN